jgi:hypothetical protein
MICEGRNGILFEITPEQELVWQYVRPFPTDDQPIKWGIFRAYRYAPDYCPQFAALPPAGGESILPEIPQRMMW